jgi:hypothetical protein
MQKIHLFSVKIDAFSLQLKLENASQNMLKELE